MGGLGGIGVEIAKYLLKHYQARLLLVGRTPLPHRSTWDAHLEQVDNVSQRIKAYLLLEPLGGEIIYSAVDVCDRAQLQQVVEQAKLRWQCELDGVIHLAGIAQEKMLVEETQASLAATLRPKVLGTWVLSQLLKDRPDSVFISFSSVNSFFGGIGVGAYAAANSFLDCFFQYQRSKGSLRSYCFSWSMWNEVGMSRNASVKELLRARGYYVITAKQGLQSLLALLHHDQAQILVGLDGSRHPIRRYSSSKSYQLQKLSACFTASTDSISVDKLKELEVRDRFQTRSTCDFLQTQEMPLTATGEIDREHLFHTNRRARQAAALVAPRNELESQLTSLWQSLLDVPQVGIHDNFFELGGSSLVAMRLIAQIEKKFGRNLPLSTLFQAPTIEQFASILSQEEWTAPWLSLVAIQPNGSKPPFFGVHAAGGVFFYYDLARHLGPDQPFYGLQAQGLDGKQVPHIRIEDMAAHYIKEIRTIQPEGPYFLGGFSFGGTVVFEMAQQLQAQGQKVALLVMFNAPHPKLISTAKPTLTFRQRISFELAVLSGHVSNISRLEPQAKLTYVTERVLDKAKGLIKQTIKQIDDPDIGPPLLDAAHHQALNSYVPQVYPGHITIFRASMGVFRWYDPQLGWGELAAGGLEIHDVPGYHGGNVTGAIFKKPNVQILANQLRASLDQAQAKVTKPEHQE